jgi:hypothetical protein
VRSLRGLPYGSPLVVGIHLSGLWQPEAVTVAVVVPPSATTARDTLARHPVLAARPDPTEVGLVRAAAEFLTGHAWLRGRPERCHDLVRLVRAECGDHLPGQLLIRTNLGAGRRGLEDRVIGEVPLQDGEDPLLVLGRGWVCCPVTRDVFAPQVGPGTGNAL